VRKSGDSPAYPIQSVEHALNLLELFSERRRLSVTEAAKLLGVAASTASRLVAMLEHHGYVAHEAGGRSYVVGTRLRAIGLAAVRELDIRAQTRPYLETLAAETGETTQIGVLHGQTVVFLDCVEGYHPLRVTSRVGSLLPAHASSTGKALLAELSREELFALYPRANLPRVTPCTLTSRSQLQRELADVVKRGYATAYSESDDDICTVAVAVHDIVGRIRCAISVAAPSSRLTQKNAGAFAKSLHASAKAIGASLF
jgi:IclR family acetate operon transcriptional repressor